MPSSYFQIELSEYEAGFLNYWATEMANQDHQSTSRPLYCVYNGKEFLQVFLTRKYAQEYIDRNSHNYKHLHIYTTSASDNPELTMLIDILLTKVLREEKWHR